MYFIAQIFKHSNNEYVMRKSLSRKEMGLTSFPTEGRRKPLSENKSKPTSSRKGKSMGIELLILRF